MPARPAWVEWMLDPCRTCPNTPWEIPTGVLDKGWVGGPQKVVTGVVATKDRGRVWHDLLISSANATPILRFYYNKMHKLQERVAKLQEQVGSPSRGAPLLSSDCSLLVFVFTCIHMCAHLRQVEKQHVHEEMMEQDLACFHLLKQSTSSNKLIHGVGWCHS